MEPTGIQELYNKEIHPATLDNLRKRKDNSTALSEQLDNPTRLFYPAGGDDLWQLEIPSVRTMAIVDMVPLLFDHDISDNPYNTYSSVINSILENQNGQFLSLQQLFQNSELSQDRQTALINEVKRSLDNQLEWTQNDFGHHVLNTVRKSQVINDNFAKVLACLILMGIDLGAIQIGKFGSDFRMRFSVDGTEKTVIFRDTEIDEKFSQADSEDYQWAQSCFDEFGYGTTGLVIKADFNSVAQHTINAVNPNVIFGADIQMYHIRDQFSSQYSFNLATVPYPDLRWGYGKAGNIQIGRRKQLKP